MADLRKPAKRHVERLRAALRDLDERERRQQERFGDRLKGSQRSADYRLAEALRAVLAYIGEDGDGIDAPKPVAFHDTDQPNGIAWCPGYPQGLRDITPLYAGPPATATSRALARVVNALNEAQQGGNDV